MTGLRARLIGCCLATVFVAQRTLAQVVPAVPVVPAAPAAPPVGFFASLGMMCKAKKERCCQSPLGKMLATIARPVHMATGGLLPSCCPPGPSLAQLAAPGPVGAAAKIQAEEAQAKARREAVKFLATVDCHYYPEAEATLIGSLRCDRNECVRWEAAHSLGTGCCCNKRTIEALTITVTGSEKDGNPSETSFRVRMEALAALQFCLSRHQAAPVRPEMAQPPEQPVALRATSPPTSEQAKLASYYVQLGNKSMSEVLREAQRAIDLNQATETPSHLPPSGQRNLITLWQHAGNDPRGAAEMRKLEPVPELASVPAPPAAPISPPLAAASPPPAQRLLVQPLPPVVVAPVSTQLEPPVPRGR